MLLLIQRLTQRPKKPSETEKGVVGIKLQSPQSPSATQQGGRGGAAKEDWKKSRHATPGCSQQNKEEG